MVKVLSIDIAIKTSFACDVFTSCSKNPFFRQMDATKNMMGFLNFFGTSGIYQTDPEDKTNTSTRIANMFQITEDSSKSPYSGPTVSCDVDYKEGDTHDPYGYLVDPDSNCKCNNCQKTCKPIDWSGIIRSNRVTDGFQTKTLYLAAFVILIVVFSRLWSCYRKRQKKLKRASLDSYDRIKNVIEKNETMSN